MTGVVSAADPGTAPAPVVPGLPLLGSFFEIRDDPFGFLERCRSDHGRVFVVRLAGQSLYIVWHPDDLKPVLMDTGKVFGRAQGTPMERIVGESILVAEGERWRRLRVISREAFRTTATAPLTDLLAGPLEALLERLGRAADAGDPVDLEAETSRCFFDFACDAIFGADLEDSDGEFTRSVGALMDEAARTWINPVTLPAWVPTPGNRRFQRARATFDRVIDRLIAERRDGGGRDDLLSLLLAANQAPEEGVAPLGTAELRNEVASYLIGAYETTATTMMWLLLLLAHHPAEAAALRGLPEDDPRVDAAIDEAMRLYPAAYAMPRVAHQETGLGGLHIPSGAAVVLMFYLTHRDPEQWEEPAAFRPARFLEGRERHPQAFLPFGLGPHRCLGKDLAMRILRAATHRVLAEFELAPAGPMPGGLPRITLRPNGPALAKVTRR